MIVCSTKVCVITVKSNTVSAHYLRFPFCEFSLLTKKLIETLKAVFLALFWLFRAIVTWHPTPVLLPGKSHGWRSVVGYSPWGCEESDTTERLHFHFSLSFLGEGNGNPLQYSCLKNPRDGGAWWAASLGSHRVGHN